MVIVVHEENLVEFDFLRPVFKPLILEYKVIFLADLLQIVNTFQLLLKKRANDKFQCKLEFSFSCPQRNLILKLHHYSVTFYHLVYYFLLLDCTDQTVDCIE